MRPVLVPAHASLLSQLHQHGIDVEQLTICYSADVAASVWQGMTCPEEFFSGAEANVGHLLATTHFQMARKSPKPAESSNLSVDLQTLRCAVLHPGWVREDDTECKLWRLSGSKETSLSACPCMLP